MPRIVVYGVSAFVFLAAGVRAIQAQQNLRKRARERSAVVAALRKINNSAASYARARPEQGYPGSLTVIGPDGSRYLDSTGQQLGSKEYGRERDFRQKLTKWLREVKTWWPECPAAASP